MGNSMLVNRYDCSLNAQPQHIPFISLQGFAANSDTAVIIFETLQYYQNGYQITGVIYPSDALVVGYLVPLFDRADPPPLQVIRPNYQQHLIYKLACIYHFQISYGAFDSSLNSLSENFYSTQASDIFVSEVIHSLIYKFGWSMVGLLHSEETSYLRVSTSIACLV